MSKFTIGNVVRYVTPHKGLRLLLRTDKKVVSVESQLGSVIHHKVGAVMLTQIVGRYTLFRSEICLEIGERYIKPIATTKHTKMTMHFLLPTL